MSELPRLDYSRLCHLCGREVSQRPDAPNVVQVDGRRTHATCAASGTTIVNEVFGPPVAEFGRFAADGYARRYGHQTTVLRDDAGVYWQCECGARGASDGSFDKSKAKASGRRHSIDVVVGASGV